MVTNKLHFEKQFDNRLYQAMIPHDGNWDEAILFVKEFVAFTEASAEQFKKQAAEAAAAQQSQVSSKVQEIRDVEAVDE